MEKDAADGQRGYERLSREELVAELVALRATPGASPPRSGEDEEHARIVHELQVHQVELEMQNRNLRETQAELEASRVRFADLYDLAPVAYFTFDLRGCVQEVNLRGAALLGRERERVLGAPFVAMARFGDAAPFWALLRRCLATGQRVEGELAFSVGDAAARTIQAAGAVVLSADGHAVACRMALTDVTHLKATEAEIIRADTANRAKSAFLANMSHEIRTPMNAILGYTQLLQRDPKLDAEEQRHLAIISKNGDHLLDLINDVLEMSKIEAGHRQLHLGVVDLTPMLLDLDRAFRQRTGEKGLSLTIDVGPAVPLHIVADEGKLRQVLMNLVGNAAKFTERGGVLVRVTAPAVADAPPALVVEVEDTGPGISPEEIGGLFQLFAQARIGIEARGGTGLGLALSRELARLMGGDVTVTSAVGVGSVFRLQIPLEIAVPFSPGRAVAGAARVIGILDGSAPRVLCVDDHHEGRAALAALLSSVGFEVREAGNGAEALAVFDAWTPRIALVDLHMPVMDGLTAIRAMRARPSGSAVTIVAVTASAFDDSRDAIFDSGADGWLRKPCREEPLFHEITRLTGVRYRYASPPALSAPSPAATPAAPAPAGTLPPELATRVQEAARIADYALLCELVDVLPREHAALAEELRRLLEGFAYEEIARRVQRHAALHP